ncbi:helix-turn-helix domain-containing protein [Chitinophaga sancti]|uniref:AraC-type DNA-binding protein n=1 Tax=Chitinophaga sancti TaxID=1004 RepID=A0A1K1MQ35_9BACT|nr:helix-turn-helix domain-containing protein [Chitinophaga sancti]WQD62889.1 helix-turn-helix domain-containing protein [Chitinophaga sancti]WQG91487.1 helix-turn-helix domain-containing protein [Chitinophaga sancti]SFW25292.1 AraC-type DNA-binding protein [Chitinophaga sancti]
MAGKKQTANIYRHAELVQDTEIDLRSTVPGFAVNCNLQFMDIPALRNNFRSDFLGIILVVKGTLTISINLEEHVMEPNSLLLATPHALKQVISMDNDAILCGLSATVDFMGKIFADKLLDLMNYFSTKYCPHWQLDNKDAATIAATFSMILHRTEEYNTHTYGKELFYHSFATLLYELGGMGQKYAKINHADFSRKENLVMAFTSLVQQHFRQQRNVQAFAEQLHVTPKYLTETVKEITGKTAGEIIDHFVILEAKRMLSDTPLSILQIAEELNFSDQSFFGKYFKRFAGHSPKEYRQIQRRY